jgi:hypothetical protein
MKKYLCVCAFFIVRALYYRLMQSHAPKIAQSFQYINFETISQRHKRFIDARAHQKNFAQQSSYDRKPFRVVRWMVRRVKKNSFLFQQPDGFCKLWLHARPIILTSRITLRFMELSSILHVMCINRISMRALFRTKSNKVCEAVFPLRGFKGDTVTSWPAHMRTMRAHSL